MSVALWETVIGLEVHVQLKTQTKMFCRCAVDFGAPPNSLTCPVCLGLPGALPVPNARAVAAATRLGLALNCQIAERTVFARKNYFYQDLPKGYQISQYEAPLCADGSFLVPGEDHDLVVAIVRAHLEEDAAKTIHSGGETGRKVGADVSLVDFNRGGAPLVEVVTAPVIHSSRDAKRFLTLLRQTIIELDVSDAEMEKGTLRVDANVSVRPAGSTELRARWELKNVNSFNYVARGIDLAATEQIRRYQEGENVHQQTFDFEPSSGALTPHRDKEEADDYRYFPEPDLAPVEPDRAEVERLRAALPELPGARLTRLRTQLGFSRALVLVSGGLDQLYDATVAAGAEPHAAANVIANELVGAGVQPAQVPAGELARLVTARPRLPRPVFAAALAAADSAGFCADDYLAQAFTDADADLEAIVADVLAEHPEQVAAYRAGKEALAGFFVGAVLKKAAGAADPKTVSELVQRGLATQ
jgi:aspartyl-tRNA(Asn)/glutamyl-tRNA(Gln) amidotransferase subunit B